ncbi:MAG: hypothetical protein ACYDBQ_05105 [Thermoplasmatota archaeon]
MPDHKRKGHRDREDVDPKRFPNLAAQNDMDREEHIRRAMANGASRKEAERHADLDMKGGE